MTNLAYVHKALAKKVANGLGLDVLPVEGLMSHNFEADANPDDCKPHAKKQLGD